MPPGNGGEDSGAYHSAKPYGGDVGGDSIARDEMVYNVGLQLLQGGAGLVNSLFSATAQMAQANAAAHQARVMDAATQAKALDQVTARGAQNGETADHLGSLQGFAHRDIAVAGVWGTGVAPTSQATVGEAADNISDEDDN